MSAKRIQTPLDMETVLSLKAGDRVLLNGTIFTARDAAHKRMTETLENGKELPIELEGQILYYVGPTPAKPGQIIGSAGPTTSGRVDKYTPRLLEMGLKGMIGKGNRNADVRSSIEKNKAIYFGAIGGSGAVISKSIKKVEMIAYEDLGPEAIRKLTVEDFPVVVINDAYGNDWYEQAVLAFEEKE